ncbi:hypothetical protein CCR75_006567 [Bremia lactucae]|uniref:Calcineurin-like phosphoesterase domain-containing protein n=1 Tax=Bremia lactucae TaxID=4779 RepID=A0A976FJ72_BRELC|nr:hypothetical protein CCR75_006567 [Bremia lactucae]
MHVLCDQTKNCQRKVRKPDDMRVVCVSDTHGLHNDVLTIPKGDVFVHAGDFTDTGERSEVLAFNEFLGRLPHRYKLVIAGNHESSFDRAFYPKFWHQYGHPQQYDPNEVRALLTNALYLEDQAVLIEGFLFYGTPWQPEFCNWAFNLPRGDALLEKWIRIPSNTDVLITHSPPMGHNDLVGHQHVGCADLLREVEDRVEPKLHVFGHVHEGYGCSYSSDGTITYINASLCTHDYEPVNQPIVFELIGPPKRGWSIPTLSLTAPSTGMAMPRSFSTNDVSSISKVWIRDNKNVGRLPTGDVPQDYDLMMHEWLRSCSQKPAFSQNDFVAIKSSEILQKEKLHDFRVDGTASGLLFESTLKLRPVRNVEKRALRYLFSQGFREPKSESDTVLELDSQNETKKNDLLTSMKMSKGIGILKGSNQNYKISRRMTVAVLDHINENEEEMDHCDREHVQLVRKDAAILCEGPSLLTQSAQSRRLKKTLQRRSAVPMLDALTEEPRIKKEEVVDAVLEQNKVANDDTVAIAAASTVIDCALCKYKVSGHVHFPSSLEILKDVKHDGEQTENLIETYSRAENLPLNRLSSWF